MELKEAEKLFEKREEEHLKEKEQLLKQEQAKCERMLGEEADKLCRFQ